MKWILLIAWSANGTAYTGIEFNSKPACEVAMKWVQSNNLRGGTVLVTCLPKGQEP